MALAAYWQAYNPGHRLGIMKPIQAGSDDRSTYLRLPSLEQTLESMTPCYYETSLLPPLAAEREGRKLKLEKVWRAFEALDQQCQWTIVEGFGGFGSPLTWEMTVADLAWDWRLPTVLVVPVVPGAIAQAIAHVGLANSAHVHLKGMVLNCIHPCSPEDLATWASVDLLQALTQKPVLGCIPYLADPTDLDKLAQVASNLEIERLLP